MRSIVIGGVQASILNFYSPFTRVTKLVLYLLAREVLIIIISSSTEKTTLGIPCVLCKLLTVSRNMTTQKKNIFHDSNSLQGCGQTNTACQESAMSLRRTVLQTPIREYKRIWFYIKQYTSGNELYSLPNYNVSKQL